MGRFAERYGPYALVTGGSSGIGRAFANEIAGHGVGLVLVARTGKDLDNAASEIAREHGVDVRTISQDLTEEGAIEKIVERVRDLKIGLLVNNAGYGKEGPFLDNPIEDDLNMIDLQVRTVYLLTREFAPMMAERGKGGIIFISSLAGSVPVPRMAVYSATKAFVLKLGESLHYELKRKGVDVLTVSPGPVRTGFMERAGVRFKLAYMDPSGVARYSLKRLGRKHSIIPGTWSKMGIFITRFVPKRVLLDFIGSAWGRFTE